MKVQIEPKPLTEPLQGASPGTTVVVEPLLVGEMQCPPAMFEDSGGILKDLRYIGVGTPRSRWWWVPCPVFLVRHPSYGPFLVDTGLHSSVATKPTANLGRITARFGRPRLDPDQTLPAQLRGAG